VLKENWNMSSRTANNPRGDLDWDLGWATWKKQLKLPIPTSTSNASP
jgi:hypothetical protein